MGATVDRLCASFRRERIAYDVIVVDEGSTDGTAAEIAARATADRKLVIDASPTCSSACSSGEAATT